MARVKQKLPRNTKQLASQRAAGTHQPSQHLQADGSHRRKHRYRPGAMALREIRHYQVGFAALQRFRCAQTTSQRMFGGAANSCMNV
mmetsp:Transcript_3020/g.8816  ORF Transcript_3020/g.8816 Transcript_3020/m.8816 type:complete len:87 (-) Transcript_3020:762-1022(-)